MDVILLSNGKFWTMSDGWPLSTRPKNRVSLCIVYCVLNIVITLLFVKTRATDEPIDARCHPENWKKALPSFHPGQNQGSIQFSEPLGFHEVEITSPRPLFSPFFSLCLFFSFFLFQHSLSAFPYIFPLFSNRFSFKCCRGDSGGGDERSAGCRSSGGRVRSDGATPNRCNCCFCRCCCCCCPGANELGHGELNDVIPGKGGEGEMMGCESHTTSLKEIGEEEGEEKGKNWERMLWRKKRKRRARKREASTAVWRCQSRVTTSGATWHYP